MRVAGIILVAVMAVGAPSTKPGTPTLKPNAPKPAQSYYVASLEFREDVRKGIAERVHNAQGALASAKAGQYGPRATGTVFVDAKEKAAAVRKATEELKKAKDLEKSSKMPDFLPEPPLNPDAIEVGDAGLVAFKIVEIPHDGELVGQLLGSRSQQLVYVTGFPTKGWVDGKEAEAVVEVTDTKSHGGRTMFVVKPFNIERWIDRGPLNIDKQAIREQQMRDAERKDSGR